MGLNDLISKLTDPYERQARLWPALLALFPLFLMLGLLYAPKMSALKNAVALASSCGGLFLLTNVCREWGKRLEPKLYEKWGGKPTTQLLRHRDDTIEGVTKKRYHAFLATKIKEPFPDREQEDRNPIGADEVYQSAVRWLLNQTRDTKRFGILFKENITYGFRRNGLAMKPVGVLISISSILWVLITQGVMNIKGDAIFSISALMALSDIKIVSLVTSFVMLFTWIFFFTKNSTRNAAFTYAETLFRACDALNNK